MSFLYDYDGNRMYVTTRERQEFLNTAHSDFPPETSTFCAMLALTGARLSEALATTPRRIDFEAGVIVIRSLKKRRAGVYRAIPVPERLVREFDAVHAIRAAQQDSLGADQRIWPWGRTTGWKRVKEVMDAAGIAGTQASAKGLRHGFAITALEAGVPLNIVSKWLGHAQLKTTALYGEATGAEERAIANRMWEAAPPYDG